MNIGIVTTWFPAGAGYVSKAYEKTFVSSGHNVFIYARGGQSRKGDTTWDRANVTWAPSKISLPTGIWEWHFRRWIRRNRIEMVLFNEQRSFQPIVVARSMGVIAGAYVDYYKQNTVEGFALYDFLVCNTKRHYSVFKWHPHCFYIPWGTDVNTFNPKNSVNGKRPLTFLVNAGWQPKNTGDRRGTLLALKAFRLVVGDCRLLVYSQVSFGEMMPEWQSAVSGDSRVELRMGTFDPFPYSEGDVYVYPSRLDGIGLTLPEAVSCGLAAIVTDSPPMTEFIKDGETGFSVKVASYLGRYDGYYWAESICCIESLASAMTQYLKNPCILEAHKKNARTFALETLDWVKNSGCLVKEVLEVPPNGATRADYVLAKKMDCQNIFGWRTVVYEVYCLVRWCCYRG